MQNNIRKAFVAALLAAAALGVSLAAPGGSARGGAGTGMLRSPGVQSDGVVAATSIKTTNIVPRIAAVAAQAETNAAAVADVRRGFVDRGAFESGFTEWAVTPESPLGSDVVVAAFPETDPLAITRNWSIFYADDTVRSMETRLADVKHAFEGATNIVWAASETVWGVAVSASRVRVPTASEVVKLQDTVRARTFFVDEELGYLWQRVTNNYDSAYRANQRAKDIEAWQATNAITRADVARGLTTWAVTPRWPVGHMEVREIAEGPDAGKWALFSPTTTVYSAATAVVPPVAGVAGEFGVVTDLLWPNVRWLVASKWTNSLDTIGLSWVPNPDKQYVTAVFDARASRMLVPTWDSIQMLDDAREQLQVAVSRTVSTNDFVAATNAVYSAIGQSVGFALPASCFPVLYMPPYANIGGPGGISFREEGDAIKMYDVTSATNRYICSFDSSTLRFREAPQGLSLFFGPKYASAVSNEWPVLSVLVKGTPLVSSAEVAALREGIPTLVGESYDFSSNSNIVRAIADIVRALGGSVTNAPAGEPPYPLRP